METIVSEGIFPGNGKTFNGLTLFRGHILLEDEEIETSEHFELAYAGNKSTQTFGGPLFKVKNKVNRMS